MAERDVRERDILVASNEFAYVQDLTKGDIVLYVGPTKISLSNTERLVELRNERFVPVRSDEGSIGVQPVVSASSAQYVVLENPAKDAAVRPVKGNNSAIELNVGRRIVVPGPASFPLWPGQRARVVAGHELYEDQYLRVRVYDRVEGETAPIGTERIIKGSEVSFYLPKTGLEVVPDDSTKGALLYVRNAVTLLDGQYCVLRGPKGRRRYVRGPGVVFPEAWEEFVVKAGVRAFAAHPLKKDRGLHVRAVKAFEAKAGDQLPAGTYQPGQELFLQNQEGFFFPTEELEVLGEVAAVQLDETEGLYVRDIASGRIRTVVGPCAFLPDPTQVELVRRNIEPETALRYGLTDAKADRAPAVTIPPSYAVLVTAKNRREVVKGPQVRILEHDEELGTLRLSTGTPKSDAARLSTCFLLVDGNKVSDLLKVRTSDHVELEVRLSYRVSFTNKPGVDDARWFNVNDYVALLCDHLGSLVRAAVRNVPVERFHAGSAEVIRSTILGQKTGEKRAGREFEENGMLVYDVEVLEVRILDEAVQALLEGAQRDAIVSEVGRKREELRLLDAQATEAVNRGIYLTQAQSFGEELALEAARRTLTQARVEARNEASRLEVVGRAQQQAEALEVTSSAESAAANRKAKLQKTELAAKVAAFKEQMGALHPELIATLKALGNQQLAAALTENLSPLAILGGSSVAEVASRLLASLPLGPDGSDAGATVLAATRKRA
jgi:hypothetical protein